MSEESSASGDRSDVRSESEGMSNGRAFGHPGIEPRWTRSAKDAVGTAYTSASRVWFTTSAGVLNEVYYPTIDRPQIRDFILLITDGKTFFHDERRHLVSETDYEEANAPAVRITNTHPGGRYRIVKEILSDPHEACVLMRVKVEASPEVAGDLRLFVLLAPPLNSCGAGNNAQVSDVAGRTLLTAHRDDTWLALGATVPFVRRSCGFVGRSDGWTDLSVDFHMDWEFLRAEDGNAALTGELDLSRGGEFTLGLVFDTIPAVAYRYLSRGKSRPLEVWMFNRQPRRVLAGVPLRIQAEVPFRLRWSRDRWSTLEDTESRAVPGLGVRYVDLEGALQQRSPLSFIFIWTQAGHWEGRDFEVNIVNE